MSLKQKIDAALARCDGCCLDDETDVSRVTECLTDALTGDDYELFRAACEALRHALSVSGTIDAQWIKPHIAVVLEALGER